MLEMDSIIMGVVQSSYYNLQTQLVSSVVDCTQTAASEYYIFASVSPRNYFYAYQRKSIKFYLKLDVLYGY
jgi:hypothetical protein